LYKTGITAGTDGQHYQYLTKTVWKDLLHWRIPPVYWTKTQVFHAAHTSGYYVKIRLNIINNLCGVPVCAHHLQASRLLAH